MPQTAFSIQFNFQKEETSLLRTIKDRNCWYQDILCLEVPLHVHEMCEDPLPTTSCVAVVLCVLLLSSVQIDVASHGYYIIKLAAMLSLLSG